jgi:serine/threonine protein kinase/formylglycine-generating enzyme required for sulfatase activity
VRSRNCRRRALCDKIASIPNEVSATRIPVIPDHEVLRVIGRGAYGEIWLARTLTGAWRAVKVVYRRTFENERAFEREFQGMSSFEPISRAHDGFVDILHVGQTSEYLYYTMELADDCARGREIDPANYQPHTLKSDLDRRQRFSAAETIALGLSLTKALEALHARGFAHRDIKPANIIFIDGVAKLADIGLVAVTGQQSFVGTEGYVPPEGPGTARADIFSLGKVLYESCSGKDRLDFPELDSELSKRADSREFLQLNDVLLKACASDPRRRYSTAAEMQDDLEKIGEGRIQKRRRWLLPVGTSLALAMVAFFALFHRPAPHLDGHLTIQTEPSDAMVAFDDHIKRSPATFDDLDARPYHLRIMSPGYDPIETTIDMARASAPPVFRLTRSRGALAMDANVPEAHFTIRSNDGKISREGSLPATLNDLPTGKYEVTATRGDWQLRKNVEVQRGQTAQKNFVFATAVLSLTSEPAGASIFIDGQDRGRAPLRVELAAREHEVIARMEGWSEEKRTISLAPHQDQSANFVFANGSVKITSAPGGANVLSDGRELGQTPLVIEEVKPGTVRYELRATGYKAAIVEGKVEPQRQTFLAQRLERTVGPAPGEPWTNSLGMKFVPLGNVRIAVWETRVQDYDAFCRATARGQVVLDFKQTPTDPAVKVNWFDAVAFCKWLTEKEHDENLIEAAQFYRLPTDAEWSEAVGLKNETGATPEARDGVIRNEFPWGKQWPLPAGAGNYADKSARRRGGSVIENYSDNFPQTSPAGSFKPNALGICDLGGNAWEWCQDGYKGEGGGRDWGVLRGGSWATSSRTELQSSYRNVVDRSERDVIFGFRCVLANDNQ